MKKTSTRGSKQKNQGMFSCCSPVKTAKAANQYDILPNDDANTRFIKIMRGLVRCNFGMLELASAAMLEQLDVISLREHNHPIIIKAGSDFWFYHPKLAQREKIIVTTNTELLTNLNALFTKHANANLITNCSMIRELTLEGWELYCALKQQTGYDLIGTKPLKDGRYYSLVLIALEMGADFSRANKQQLAIIAKYGQDFRQYPNAILLHNLKTKEFWFYDGLKYDNDLPFKLLPLAPAEIEKFRDFFTSYAVKANSYCIITEPNASTLAIDEILTIKANYQVPLWRCIGSKQTGFTDGFVVAKAYPQLGQEAQQWVYKTRLHSYDVRLMLAQEATEFKPLTAWLEADRSPIIIKINAGFALYYLDASNAPQLKFLELTATELAIFAGLFNMHAKLLQDGRPSAPLIAMDVNRLAIPTPAGNKKGIMVFEIIKAKANYIRGAGDYEWYFYEAFCEAIGSELFRYILGDAAPKNRLVAIPNQAPGLVSKFFPGEFANAQELREALAHKQKTPLAPGVAKVLFKLLLQRFVNGTELSELVEQLQDLNARQIMKEFLLKQSNIERIIAATCFFNDTDGKLANILLVLQQDGSLKVARVDFGTTLAQLADHTYGMGIYLFGGVDFNNYQSYSYDELYRAVLDSKAFLTAVQELTQINMEHLKVIVSTAVARFAAAWRDISLDSKSITKFYTHLFGTNATTWPGYIAGEQLSVTFDSNFVTAISGAIVTALRERQEVFSLFAEALEHLDVLKLFEPAVAQTLITAKDLKIHELVTTLGSNNLPQLANCNLQQLDAVMHLLTLKEPNSTATRAHKYIINQLTHIDYVSALKLIASSFQFELAFDKVDDKYNLLINIISGKYCPVDLEVVQELIGISFQSICKAAAKANNSSTPYLITTTQFFTLKNLEDKYAKTCESLLKKSKSLKVLDSYTDDKRACYGVNAIIAIPDLKSKTVIVPITKSEAFIFNKRVDLLQDNKAVPNTLKIQPLIVENQDKMLDDYNRLLQAALNLKTAELQLENLLYYPVSPSARVMLWEQLFMAAGTGNLAVVTKLITALKDDMAEGSNLWRQRMAWALHIAVTKNQAPLVEFLVNYLIANSIYDFNQPLPADDVLCTLLHRALIGGNVAIIEFLLKKLIKYNISFDIDASTIDSFWGLKLVINSELKDRVKIVASLTDKLINTNYKNNKLLLFMAVKYDALAVLETLIRRTGIYINVRDNNQQTALHIAASNGRAALLAKLLECSLAAINYQDKNGRTPLHLAAENGHRACIEVLLKPEFGGDMAAKDLAANIPLHLAAANGHADCLELLISQQTINLGNQDGRTALHLAVLKGKIKCLTELVAAKADLNAQDKYKDTPLQLAISANMLECAMFLLKAGALIDHINNIMDADGRKTLLHLAVDKGIEQYARELIEGGFDINAKDHEGKTPLHYAALNGHLECLDLLLHNNVTVDNRDYDGYTPLHFAAQNGHYAGIELLIKFGAKVDVGIKRDGGDTPLILAASNGRCQCVQLLLAKGADINAGNNGTPLDWALNNNMFECATELIKHGANVDRIMYKMANKGIYRGLWFLIKNGADVNKSTLLHCVAASEEKNNCLELFLENNADMEKEDLYGMRPLHIAAREGNINGVMLLIKKGANVAAKDAHGHTPLKIAVQEYRLKCALILLEKSAEEMIKHKEFDDLKNILYRLSILKETDTKVDFVINEDKDNILQALVKAYTRAREDTPDKLKIIECMIACVVFNISPTMFDKNKSIELNLAWVKESTAALNRHLEEAKDLLAQLGDTKAVEQAITMPIQGGLWKGNTLLFLAASNGRLELVKSFLAQLGDTKAVKEVINTPIEVRKRRNISILHAGIKINSIDSRLVKYLLQNGASIALSDEYAVKLSQEPQLKKTYEVYQDFIKLSAANSFNDLNATLANLEPEEIILNFSLNDNWENMLHFLVKAYINSKYVNSKGAIKKCIGTLISLDIERIVLRSENRLGKTPLDLILENTIKDWLRKGRNISILHAGIKINSIDSRLVKYLLQNGSIIALLDECMAKLNQGPLKRTYEVYQHFIKLSADNSFNDLNATLANLKSEEIILNFSLNDNWENMLHFLVKAYINSKYVNSKGAIKKCIGTLISLDIERIVLRSENRLGKTPLDLILENTITELLRLVRTQNEMLFFNNKLLNQSQASNDSNKNLNKECRKTLKEESIKQQQRFNENNMVLD